MQSLQGIDRALERERPSAAASTLQGFLGWVVGLLQRGKGEGGERRKQLRIIEALPLGGKRQLLLIECAGESFLVGGGSESVQTIVRLQGLSPLNSEAVSAEGRCR